MPLLSQIALTVATILHTPYLRAAQLFKRNVQVAAEAGSGSAASSAKLLPAQRARRPSTAQGSTFVSENGAITSRASSGLAGATGRTDKWGGFLEALLKRKKEVP